jgi:hypothetical protein
METPQHEGWLPEYGKAAEIGSPIAEKVHVRLIHISPTA